MKGEIIGCSDRGTVSATLSDSVVNALNKWNSANSNDNGNSSNDSSGNTGNNTNSNTGCGCSGQEKPPYYHPPYVN